MQTAFDYFGKSAAQQCGEVLAAHPDWSTKDIFKHLREKGVDIKQGTVNNYVSRINRGKVASAPKQKGLPTHVKIPPGTNSIKVGKIAEVARKHPHLQYFEVMVTPDMATFWLSTTVGNRSLRRKTIENLAQQMKDKEWELTGEAIGFTSQGKLANGHHRLKACHESGVSFPATIIWGLSDDAVKAMDDGVRRVLADYLPGEHSRQRAAMAAQLFQLRKGAESKNPMLTATMFAVSPAGRWQGGAIEKQYRQDIIAAFAATKAVKGCSFRPTVALMYFLFSREDKKLADEFFSKLINGAPGPTNALKNAMMAKRQKPLTRQEYAELFIRAWNAFCEDDDLRTLRLRDKSSPFPQLPLGYPKV